MESNVLDVLRLRYSYPRLQWLIVTAASTCALYMSSEEIWRTVDGNPFPEVSSSTILVYAGSLSMIIFLIHVTDVRRVVSKKTDLIVATLLSMAIDLGTMAGFEFLTLWTIQVLPQEPLKIAKLLLIGMMPASLGVVTLSSLTADVLKKQISGLHLEILTLKKEICILEERREEERKNLKEFQRKRLEFEQYFEREKGLK